MITFSRLRISKANLSSSFAVIATMAILGVSSPVNATSLYAGVDQYQYDLEIDDIELDLNPFGIALGGMIDVNEKLAFTFELGKWEDDGPLDNGRDDIGDFESNLIIIGLQYDFGAWKLNGSYSMLDDEASVIHGRENEFRSAYDEELNVLRLSLLYEQEVGLWMRYFGFGFRATDSDADTFFDQSNQEVRYESDDQFIHVKVGGDYYLNTGDNKGWFLGGSLSWYQELSSDTDETIVDMDDMNPPPPPPRGGPGAGGGGNGNGGGNGGGNGNGGANVNRTFGDNYGVMSLYATYQINNNWSLDWTSALGFDGDMNSDSHALTLSYQF